MRLLSTDTCSTSLLLPPLGAKFQGGIGKSNAARLLIATCKASNTQLRYPKLRFSVPDTSRRRYMMLSTTLKVRCASEKTQTQTLTRKSPAITLAPTFVREKLPKLDDGGSGLPPHDGGGGGGGGGGGHNSSGCTPLLLLKRKTLAAGDLLSSDQQNAQIYDEECAQHALEDVEIEAYGGESFTRYDFDDII